jgi:hypothetical protein
MSRLIVSLNENILKLSVASDDSFKSTTVELDDRVAVDSAISDPTALSEIIYNLTAELTSGNKNKKHELYFLVEPDDILLRFVTVNKRDGDPDQQIIKEISSKLDGYTLDDLYFSYQKIAPFVYQFVGIKKDKIDMYIEVSNQLSYDLSGIVPWVSLLPKYTKKNEPSIFISKTDTSQVIALSELGGIYFSQVFQKEKSNEEIEQLVSELSVYKRPSPITNVYTLLGDSFSLNPQYDVIPLIPADEIGEELKGYEIHALFNRMVLEEPSILETQVNLLNLLPVPVAAPKNNALLYVGAVAVVVMLLGGGVFMFAKNRGGSNVPGDQNSGVLSGTNEQPQTTVTVTPTPVPTVAQIEKADLKIRVENAAGISGLAARTQRFLENKGYTVAEIDTADESGRTDTLIKIKDSKKDFLTTITADMQSDYEVVTESNLPEDSEFDIIIMAGAEN